MEVPDEDAYKKLTRAIKYLRSTQQLTLNLTTSSILEIKWWVDASFATHPDMRSHTGGVMMVGKGAVYTSSIRQKINTKSSTEAEMVGVSDLIGQVLWTRSFLEEQGHKVNSNTVYQDNKSAILLEENGKGSSSKRTRHMDIRYLFITDRITAGKISLEYCPISKMIADFYTKPLQGNMFTKYRDLILNDNLKQGISLSTKQRQDPGAC